MYKIHVEGQDTGQGSYRTWREAQDRIDAIKDNVTNHVIFPSESHKQKELDFINKMYVVDDDEYDYWFVNRDFGISDWDTEASYKPEETTPVCKHISKEYFGLNERFNYCEKCGVKL